MIVRNDGAIVLYWATWLENVPYQQLERLGHALRPGESLAIDYPIQIAPALYAPGYPLLTLVPSWTPAPAPKEPAPMA